MTTTWSRIRLSVWLLIKCVYWLSVIEFSAHSISDHVEPFFTTSLALVVQQLLSFSIKTLLSSCPYRARCAFVVSKTRHNTAPTTAHKLAIWTTTTARREKKSDLFNEFRIGLPNHMHFSHGIRDAFILDSVVVCLLLYFVVIFCHLAFIACTFCKTISRSGGFFSSQPRLMTLSGL